MTFTADGKVTREPQDKAGAKGEGTWKLSKDGFCTTWKGSAQNCYTLVNVDKNKWSVVKGADHGRDLEQVARSIADARAPDQRVRTDRSRDRRRLA